MAALQRLQSKFNKCGMGNLAARVSAVQALIGPAVAKALVTRADVLQRRAPKTSNPVSMSSAIIAKEVSLLVYMSAIHAT